MNKFFFLALLGIVSISSFSCVYNNEEELYPAETCDTLHVTYSGSVLPILQQNCYGCHDNAHIQESFVALEGYDNLIAKVMDGQLINAINHTGDITPMPKDREKLPECEIRTIEIWVDAGAPDN